MSGTTAPAAAQGAIASARFPFVDLFTWPAALALLAGATAAQAAPALPARWCDVLLALVGLALMWRRPGVRWLGYALLGAGWTLLRADVALSERLPAPLEGEDVVVEGRIVGLPRVQDDSARFDFAVATAELDGAPISLAGRLRLGWYDDAPALAPCAHWRLLVHVKRPRGLIDPGAFDFERYALEQGVVATGYVRDDARNADLGDAGVCIDGLRARILAGIDAAFDPGPVPHLLRALAFGDQQAMDEHEWAVARATGIPHLIAISGLHIALFASIGVLLVRIAWKIAPRVVLRWPAPIVEALAGLVFAVTYAIVAGFGLPTQRALVMIAAVLAATLARRARAPVQGLALALVVLIAWNPLCVLSAGFWLSFVGVAWLMFCLGGGRRPLPRWRELVRAQGVASIGLLPLGIWFFGQGSLVGPLANFAAVPLICFCILPATVFGALITLVSPTAGAPLLHLAGAAMQALWWALERMASWPAALHYFPEPSVWALALGSIGALWLLAPRGVPARGLGILLLLPLVWPARPALGDGEFDAYVLDVGQGLAVVVRTREHTLVYDTGARHPSGFDLGEAAVVPALHALGVERIDKLVVSHGDNDHAGGAAAVLAAFPGAEVESGEPQRLSVAAAQCRAGEAWRWNGVAFRVVHPHEPFAARGNDRCCVLEVRSGASALLLSGDVTSAVEGEVADALAPAAPHTVLQVPHHGSRTSSSQGLLDALAPELGVVSAGYRNRFNHPQPEIVARYRDAGIALLNTADGGFVHLRATADGVRVIELGRRDRHPYWRE